MTADHPSRPDPAVLCIGEAMVELVLPAQAGGAPRLGFAGDTLNTAVYLRRALGSGGRVAYLSRVGRDPLSRGMLDFIAGTGVETGLIGRDPERLPGLYAISTDAAGERRFLYWRENSAARGLFGDGAGGEFDAMAGFDLIYLSGITLAILAPAARAALIARLAQLRGQGARVAFDPNYRPRLWPDVATARAAIGAAWAVCDIALPSAEDEAALWGDADVGAVLMRLRGLGLREGAVKCGMAGPVALDPAVAAGSFRPARRVIDTTGAGDSFNAAYLAARLRGETEARALARGHALAARVVGLRGAFGARAALRGGAAALAAAAPADGAGAHAAATAMAGPAG